MKYKKVKYRYSGDKSKRFWKIINKLPLLEQNELFSLGVALQNLEGFVLKRLSECNPNKVEKI